MNRNSWLFALNTDHPDHPWRMAKYLTTERADPLAPTTERDIAASMTYTPMPGPIGFPLASSGNPMGALPSPFQLPIDHPDHPYQQMRRAGIESPFALTQGRPAWNPESPETAAIEEDEDEEGPAGEDCLCAHLTLLAAFTHEVQMQAHLLHLDYEGGGGNFLSVHAFLKSAYERHLEEFDSLLEAVRAMGRKTPATHKELLAILPAFEHAMSTAECRLSNYRENLLQQRKMAQKVEEEAQEAREIGIANMLAEIDAAAAKAAWFIAATLKG